MRVKKALTNSEISSFCSQTALILKAGITPADGMNILLQDTKDSVGKAIIGEILATCQQGESFYTAIQQTQVFPPYVLHMINLGEESGNLDNVMESLSNYYEREEAIAESIKNAVSYPFLMIGMMLLVIIVLISKVLPIFNQVFIQLGSEMNGFSHSLLVVGSKINQYSFAIIIFLILCAILYFLIFKTSKGKKMASQFFSSFFVTKPFYDKIASGRFASGMALTLGSGLDTYNSLDLVYDLVDNTLMQEKISACRRAIETGSNFSDALLQAEIFSNLYSQMVAIGFKTGSIDIVMQKIAINYEKETDRKIHSIISILEPSLVIFLSIIVGMILLSVILPLMGIMSSIG